MLLLLIVYLAGVAIGVAVMRDPWPTRIGTALAWPLGPAAFLIVVSILVLAAFVLWPLRMLAMAAAVGALVYIVTA
jgi:hypothetical protein